MRMRIDFSKRPQIVKFTDSMNAALVAALTAAGMPSARLVGERAVPWTFGMEGEMLGHRGRQVRSVIVSSPDPDFAAALNRLNPAHMTVHSRSGDRIDGEGARLVCADDLDPGIAETMIRFVSPIILMTQKQGREKTFYCEDFPKKSVGDAIMAGLEKRAGRDLDLSVSVDPLHACIEGGRKHLVRYRKLPNGKSLILPGFMVPLTLAGKAEDLRFAYLAGLGAKTRAGNGCLIIMRSD